ncbi:MAG TPA: PRC-barrel domain-containing protein, partial [Thermohalobaculum sp.]|nr:PRC-barrel domain-containing protein [Thermohalobaculum sp.]
GETQQAEGEEPAEGESQQAEGEEPAEGESQQAEGEEPAEGESQQAEGEEPAEGESQQAEAEVDVDVDEVESEELAAEVDDAAQETEQTTEEMAAEGEQTTEEAVAQTEEAAPEEEQVAMTETTAETGALMVGDLTGQDVFNEAGEDLGDLERIIRLDGQTWAVISAGGFLGIGDKDIPVELDRLSITEEGIIVQGLTEEQIEAAQDVDLEGAEELPADAELQTAN